MFQDFLFSHYLILKSIHLIAVISWMAGLLYLPRLFVYHVSAQGEASEMLKVMERRLFKFIMNPAYIVTWILGLSMIFANPALMSGGWMHAKLSCVIVMSVMHHLMGRWRKDFAADQNVRSDKFYRIMNEVPTGLMIIIVPLAIIKPF